MKEIRTTQQWYELLYDNDNFVIYGAGWGATILSRSIRYFEKKVYCYMVSNLIEEYECDEIIVRQLDIDYIKNNNCVLVLGGLEASSDSMRRLLEQKDYSDFIMLTDAVFMEIKVENLEREAMQWRHEYNIKSDDMIVAYVYPGYYDTTYAEERLIINRIRESKYIPIPKVLDDIHCVGTEYEKEIEAYKSAVEACCDFSLYDNIPIDLIHTFNSVCRTSHNWIASFESCMPRVIDITDNGDIRLKELAELICRDNCLGIFPISYNAYSINKRMISSILPYDMADIIISKMHVLHPPQKSLISEKELQYKIMASRERVKFIFIGHGFFIKGGKEIISAFKKLENMYHFELTIISRINIDDYYTHATYEDRIRCLEIINNTPWIHYYESLSNDKVVELCKRSDVGLLPSYADTYGYSVLEMQAAGCPVVTTNIRVFPEINDDECGWMCNLPIDEEGICGMSYSEELRELLEKHLIDVLSDILSNPEVISDKAMKAWNRIDKEHNMERYESKLRSILYF